MRVGNVIGAKYKVERMLGFGGMGRVVAARHLELGQLVAIKILLDHVARDRSAKERFIREARSAVRLTSDHVCRVFDVGELSNGVPYMVMEYLEGTTLSDMPKPLPLEDVVEFAIGACDALGDAHALGIVHRDIKPANLFVMNRSRGRRTLKVLDFGISKAAGGEDEGLTRTDQLLGTPRYMSPEQIRSPRDIDGRADLWSLGVCLYQLATGRLPYEESEVLHLAARILATEPTPITSHAPKLPAAFVAIVDKCLQRDPAARYANAEELGRDLARFARSSSAPDAREAPAPALAAKPLPALYAPPPGPAPTETAVPVPPAPALPSEGPTHLAFHSSGRPPAPERLDAPARWALPAVVSGALATTIIVLLLVTHGPWSRSSAATSPNPSAIELVPSAPLPTSPSSAPVAGSSSPPTLPPPAVIPVATPAEPSAPRLPTTTSPKPTPAPRSTTKSAPTTTPLPPPRDDAARRSVIPGERF